MGASSSGIGADVSGRRIRLARCAGALVLAFAFFSVLFLRAGDRFWTWLSLMAPTLAGIAFLFEPAGMRETLRRRGPVGKVLLFGVLSALLLYGVFAVGNLAARALFPFGATEIESVYRQGAGAPRWAVGLLLFAVVGPGEELFWRGYVQRRLSAEFGWVGSGLSVLTYGAVHVATGNLTLVLAALVCGGFWALLYEVADSVWINMISHAFWAAAIFVVFPLA